MPYADSIRAIGEFILELVRHHHIVAAVRGDQHSPRTRTGIPREKGKKKKTKLRVNNFVFRFFFFSYF